MLPPDHRLATPPPRLAGLALHSLHMDARELQRTGGQPADLAMQFAPMSRGSGWPNVNQRCALPSTITTEAID